MKKLLYSSLAIAAMAVSCQEAELENNGAANNGEVFRIEVPISETKTVYTPPTKVTWATGDEITVIVNDTDANKFTNSEGNYFETTEFIPEAGTEYTYHAFYPYSSFVTSVDEAGKTDTRISVPSTASASQSGLNSTAHVQGVLYGDGTATGTEAPVIDMKHLTALLKIDVTNNYSEAITLRSITVSTNADGQYLSGRFDVNLNDGTLTPNAEQLDRCVSSSTLGISDGILEAGATASFYLSTTEFTVPVGSTLTISAESDKGTAEDVRTYPQEMVFAAGTVNTATFSFENPEQTIEKLTVAEFLAKDVDANTYYELTGTISNIINTQHGNFDLTDDSGSTVYVYGLTASRVTSNDQSFASLGLREGDVLTLCGTRDAYKGDPQVGGPAYYISHVAVPYCDVTPSTLSVDAAEGATTFAIESNENWEITSSNTSYTVSPASGNGDAEITVTYPANETEEAITVTFTVKSESGEKTVTLTQASASQITVTWNTVDPTTQSWTSETHDTYGNGYAYSDQGIKVGYYQYESTTKPNTTSSGHIRVYKSSELVISAENGGIIKSVTLECSESKYCGDLSVSDGSVAVATTSAPYKITWSGFVDVFEAQAAEKQVRITKITVVYE